LDEIVRRESSSGGVFSALAHRILALGGVVAGAAFDDQLVVRHILIDNAAEVHRLRGSKYVQSQMDPVLHRQVRDLLRAGRRVLFSGTPCQVGGLNAFLGTEYENLLTCDLVCHGVPSPKVFDAYKTMLEDQYGARVRRIDFRRKDCGWKRFSVSLSFDNHTEYRRTFTSDPFMLGFLQNTYLRHACHRCRFSRLPRIADISLGDFWGLGDHHPEWDDDRGTSLILVQTEKGRKAIEACRDALAVYEADLKQAIRSNPCICSPVSEGKHRAAFFRDLDRLPFDKVITKYISSPPLWRRAVGTAKRKVLSVIQDSTKTLSP
jgi:coenzyme F420-reducing hydrogenase beta subunit